MPFILLRWLLFAFHDPCVTYALNQVNTPQSHRMLIPNYNTSSHLSYFSAIQTIPFWLKMDPVYMLSLLS